MPWCPQCKTEYQEGFTTCKDCKVDLVDNLEEAIEFIPFFHSEDEKLSEKLASFFEYSGIPSEISYDEENESYIVSVPPELEKDARKYYEAFYYVEAERMMSEKIKNANLEAQKASEDVLNENDTTADEDKVEDFSDLKANEDEALEEEEETYKNDIPSDDISVSGVHKSHNSVYVMKADQYKDLSGSVGIFLFFGIAGMIFVILNVTQIISVLYGWLPNLVMAALFLFFLGVAFTTSKKAKKVRSEIDAENLLTRDINKWLKENVTEDFLASIHDDNISEEANYIHNIDYIKELLLKEFGNQNLAYLDRLIDEYYSNTFDIYEE